MNFMDENENNIFKNECKNTIAKVQTLLKEYDEWILRFDRYAQEIDNNLNNIKSKKKNKFNESSPLYLYMNVTNAKNQMEFSLRFLGQDVASLKNIEDKITISTSKYEQRNRDNFECAIALKNNDWRSIEAANFRCHFSGYHERKNIKKKNNEHRIESLLLTEFSKKQSKDKILCNIQPIKLANIARFPMTTPLSASNTVKYSYANGGNIDILSRIGIGKATKLCIMELKDENVKNEPPKKAIQQGLAYATFIRELLRSNSGKQWWKIFGFNGKLPEQLELYVACVMPLKDNFTSFTSNIISIDHDRFHLHYIYFKEANNTILDIKTSLKQCIAKIHI